MRRSKLELQQDSLEVLELRRLVDFTQSFRAIPRAFLNLYMSSIASRLAVYKLNTLAKRCQNAAELVDLAFDFEYNPRIRRSRVFRIKPLQVKSEVLAFCKAVQELSPRRLIEIGSAMGGTLFLLAHILKPEKIVSIDLPGGAFGGGYPSWKIPFYKSLGNKGAIKLIRADSHDKNTVFKTKSFIHGDADLLFIDGDHTYLGVKKDFQMYSPFIHKGGLIAFHDIVTHDDRTGCGVDRFWNKIKSSYKFDEIVESRNQRWAGIGLLYV